MPIERVACFKFLGVIIDSNLTWSHHINYISNKLTRICGVLSRFQDYVPVLILKIIYNSLFLDKNDIPLRLIMYLIGKTRQ